MKITITRIQNSLEEFNSNFTQSAKRIKRLESRKIKTVESMEQEEKRWRKSKQNLRDLWYTSKWTNIYIIGFP